MGIYSYEINKRRQENTTTNRELANPGVRVRVVDPNSSGGTYTFDDIGVVWELCRDENEVVTAIRVEWLTNRGDVGAPNTPKLTRVMTLFLWEFEIEKVGFFTRILDRIRAYRAERKWGEVFP